MKKNDWILIVSVILYSFLFYNQFAGLNFLIFNIAMISGLWMKDKTIAHNRKWQLSAFFSIATSIAITIYGNGLAVFANVIALSLLSSFSLKGNNSFLFSLAFSFYSYATSVFYMVIDWQKRANNEASRSVPSVKKSFLIIIPILVAFLFLFLYRASNPLFNDFIKKINLDFISFELIFFTICGFVLLYGFYYHRKIGFISAMDENSKQTVLNEPNGSTFLFGKTLTQSDELFSGKLLFILLNSLILILNILDYDFLFISHQLPDGITYSEFVHQGIGALIFSILISVFIIIFYFRGEINFSEKNKVIKALAYLWIIQNVIMLISTAMRNGLYISEYGLTYKRIGVYVYLLLTVIGLVTTYIKIVNHKTASYLIRINSWLFYFVMVVSCFINWDMLITSYNVKHSGKSSKEYLVTLSGTNLPVLFSLESGNEIYIETIGNDSMARNEISYQRKLGTKLLDFVSDGQKRGWRSFNYDHTRVLNELSDMNFRSEITFLCLPGKGLYKLNDLKSFYNVTSLDIASNYIESISEVNIFPGLKRLNISFNRLKTLNGIENLHNLEYLNIKGNSITDYSSLLSLKKLKQIHLPENITQDQLNSIMLKFPEIIIVK